MASTERRLAPLSAQDSNIPATTQLSVVSPDQRQLTGDSALSIAQSIPANHLPPPGTDLHTTTPLLQESSTLSAPLEPRPSHGRAQERRTYSYAALRGLARSNTISWVYCHQVQARHTCTEMSANFGNWVSLPSL